MYIHNIVAFVTNLCEGTSSGRTEPELCQIEKLVPLKKPNAENNSPKDSKRVTFLKKIKGSADTPGSWNNFPNKIPEVRDIVGEKLDFYKTCRLKLQNIKFVHK